MLERSPGKDHANVGGSHADPARGGARPMALRWTFARGARVD
ncbi:MAG: hypothetical protein ACK4U0_21065 [Mesorhizobium sp.]